jgi:hypothetical protein
MDLGVISTGKSLFSVFRLSGTVRLALKVAGQDESVDLARPAPLSPLICQYDPLISSEKDGGYMNSDYGPKIQLVIASIVASNFPDSKVALSGGYADRVELVFEDETVIYFDDEGTHASFEKEKKSWLKYERASFIDLANNILQSLANEDYLVFEASMDEDANQNKVLINQNPLHEIQCKNCLKTGGLKKIIYGMPSKEFDFDKFISGGCCPPELSDRIGCIFCKWETSRIEISANL